MTEKRSIENEIKQIQNTYYNENNKNMFIKTKQKFSCAENVTDNLGIDNLIEKTIYYNSEGTLCFDYTIFKTYAHPNMYIYFSEHVYNMIQYGIEQFKTVCIEVNVNSLTMTAIERYKDLIIYLSQKLPITTIDCVEKITFTHSSNITKNIMQLINLLFTKDMATKIKERVIVN